MNPKANGYINRAKWRAELAKLRTILLGCGLGEELKWGKPCYTFQDSNVVIMAGFKEYCALLFCKGALLKDGKQILITPGENTQAARQVRFTSAGEIDELEPVLKAYIREAMEVEKAGLKVEYKKVTEHKVPSELQAKLDENAGFKAAFKALTPGRQRGYLMYFAAPKQSETRSSRVEKCMGKIFEGKGLNDDYAAARKRDGKR